ncbi:MAG: hypothetical protein ABI813_14920 [Bacteroidota bacterium]
MELSLKNYKTILTKELLKKAGKCLVRECDETEKGHFIAYVDEGSKTFDLSLNIAPDMRVNDHHCDCKMGSNHFCCHKAALLVHIGKELKTGSKKTMKTIPSNQLLDNAEPGELKEWIRVLFLKNRDIELSFIHHFSSRTQLPTVAETVQLTNDAIKAVIKNRKNIDPTELKKIIELWAAVHNPIVQHYLTNLTDTDAFLNFHSIMETCYRFQFNINNSSNKIPKYIEGLLQQVAPAIIAIQEEEDWMAATGLFSAHIVSSKATIAKYYLLHLENIIGFSSSERKTKLVQALAIQYRQFSSNSNTDTSFYTEIIFRLVEANQLFSVYYNMFKPITYNNAFNLRLIRLLVETGLPELAANYCQDQIRLNTKEEYNIPYLLLLKEIYTLEKDETKLAAVLTTLFPLDFNFEDFRFISNRISDEEERKKFRTKMLTKAKHSSTSGNTAACLFCFNLMDAEKKYGKMIEYIKSYTPYSIILHYFEPMVLTDMHALLKAVLYKDESFMWYDPSAGDENCFPALTEKMITHYTSDYLKKAIGQMKKDRSYYLRNRLIAYLEENLAFG